MPLPAERLAPLQIIMLRDSLAAEGEGLHVEQVEIIFTRAAEREKIAVAWAEVVARTEVLQMAFVLREGEPHSWRKTSNRAACAWNVPICESFEKWLAADRGSPLLRPDAVPWRIAYWPRDRRFVWTFHHALLDGRSISRILRAFFRLLSDGTPPEPAAVTCWTSLTDDTIVLADEILRKDFEGFEPPDAAFLSSAPSKAVRCLGEAAAVRLGVFAAGIGVSSAAVLTWTWGQAVIRESNAAAAVVEQVRCGAPQNGRVGFSMNTLPLVIRTADSSPLDGQLQAFRNRLLAMRKIESIAPFDLPREVIEITHSAWSSVMMVEHGTLAHLAEPLGLAESITLHECPCESLTAAAFVLPDLRLEVEGPRNSALLDVWAGIVAALLEGGRFP
jgi:hypothetical protein